MDCVLRSVLIFAAKVDLTGYAKNSMLLPSMREKKLCQMDFDHLEPFRIVITMMITMMIAMISSVMIPTTLSAIEKVKSSWVP